MQFASAQEVEQTTAEVVVAGVAIYPVAQDDEIAHVPPATKNAPILHCVHLDSPEAEHSRQLASKQAAQTITEDTVAAVAM